MPILTPILDTRTWDDLRRELVARIPVYNPEWTDHHPSDPGITLLELAAFLGETALFKFNQIPETARLEFLRLLDVALLPARPATTLVELATDLGDGPLVSIGTRVSGGDLDAETVNECRVWPVRARAAIKRTTDRPADPELLDFVDRTEQRLDLGDRTAVYYTTTFARHDPAAPDQAVLDTDLTSDRTLWVALVADDPGALDQARGELVNIGFAPTDEAPDPGEVTACPGLGAEPVVPSLRWRITTGVTHDDRPSYADLDVVGDTTRGFTTAGVVRFRLPAAAEPVGVFPADPDLEGAGDRPPLVTPGDLDGEVLCWLRIDRPDPTGSLGRVRWVGANAAGVVARQSAPAEALGSGDGDSDQEFSLSRRDLLVDSIEVQVEESGRWVGYHPVDAFLPIGADDRHVVVDAEAGTVRFGRPPHQRVPQIGERIRVAPYRWGGGAAGNVPAGTIDTIAFGRPVTVHQPLDATGGADRETLTDGLDRVGTELRRRDRAVTASDFAELAYQADPGVVRAEVLARFRPSEPGQTAPGSVTVIVWPDRDPVHPGAPRPTRSLLDRVCAHLDRRRLITTELYVVPPTYVPLAVSVGIAVKPGHGIDAVRRWVALVVRQYLAPVPPFGPEGDGWPLGRLVRAAELEAAALQVDGVQYLTGLLLAAVDPDGRIGEVTDRVDLAAWQVPHLVTVTVVDGPPPTPGGAPPEPARTVAVPVPELLEEC
ncbi:MAG: putative baseplate assembly protein [Acidimicrobiales bacterium]